ncbi:flagellar assembly protein FliW [Demequina sp.]|uniref:flagellar assembly protein FliW n=1 Tax=Demequina sp. TaxID=2050685 RepID=UPI003A8AF790
MTGPLPAPISAAWPERFTFVEAPPGLAGLTTFEVAALDESGLLVTLRAVDEPSVRLFALLAAPYFPDYRPTVDAAVLERLGLGPQDAATIAVIVSPGASSDHTANLLAPVIANARTGAALQVVLDGDAWPLRAPLAAPGQAH